ncbi:hypothetical protein PMG11_03412 [Penicillium brasilianum]|uniref:HNH nuclease domain-containing protein n=1 Tax=Penicillium brasilianum TaxID=104259 RepID=A0A0F7VDG1_PENBI|nr:hypothetical protein PMG11_03412 [Penicillium brasilianum]
MSIPPSTPNPAPPFQIPERTSSLLGETRLQAVRQLMEYKSYAELVRQGILEARDQQRLPPSEFTELISPVLGRLTTANSTLRVLKRQRQAITDDLAEDVASRRRRLAEPSDQGLLERAYADTILTRVMSTCAKQSALVFDKKRFKSAVNDYYGIKSQRPTKEYSWCHVIGDWIAAELTKAAHIVPQSLHETEVAHIFGDDDEVLSNPQNAVSLHKGIERLLDQGAIVIVPSPGDFTTPTTWRCLVLDRSMDKDIVFYRSKDSIIRVKDLHERPLIFLSDNRPRRRYLYFRFVISYLNAKRRQVDAITVPMETKKFWPSGGAYLHSSSLKALGRCVSGCEIPEQITATQTFEVTSLEAQDIDASTALAAGIIDLQPPQTGPQSSRIRQYVIESARFIPSERTFEASKDPSLSEMAPSETSEDPLALSRENSPSLHS